MVFVLSEPQERLFEDPNFNLLLRVCTQSLAEHDITLVMMIAGTTEDRKRVVRYLPPGHVDGVLLVSTHAGNPLLDELRGRGRAGWWPAARPLGHERDIAYVAADDRDGARQMTQYLRRSGPQEDRHDHRPARHPRRRRPAGRLPRRARPARRPALIVHGDYTRAAARSRWTSCSPRRPTSTRSSSAPT